MHYYTYLFDIMNTQEDYAKCLQVIEYIQGKESECLADLDFLDHIKYAISAHQLSLGKINSYKKAGCYSELPIVTEGNGERYVFQVDCSSENDMVNLIYFCLLSDALEGKSVLCIKETDDNYKLIANVKDLLADVANSGTVKECYSMKDGIYRLIYLDSARNTKRFSPIYRIDEQEQPVAFWGQSVHTFLLKLYRENIIEGGQYEYTRNYFLPHIVPSTLRTNETKVMWKDNKKSSEVRLINIMVECFCTKEKNIKKLSRKRYEIWKSAELYDLVKDMPLLAMYIFCVFDYFLKNQEESPYESIREEIFNARDMADGILQILENIYHSEKKRGFFCFRVHNDSEGRSRQYLSQHYLKYMEQKKIKKEEVQDYLEVKVVDFSHCTVPQKFNDNFIRRMKCASESDKKIYTEIQEQAQEINVRSFFEAIPFWQKYNEISENIVHHYGLQVFDSFVSCYEGYFRVRSQKGYQIVTQENAYSTIHDDNEAFDMLGLPGTQYDIVLPFKKQKTLQNITLNVNINYTAHLLNKYKTCKTIEFTTESCMRIFEKIKNERGYLSYQEKKERTIHELEQKLSVKLKGADESTIMYFSANKIATTMIELFCKTIMLYIAKKPREQTCYIMITDCTQSHFVEITRMLALFYDKQGVNTLMAGTQIFLSGQHPGEEFLISGCNLGEVIGSTEKLAFSRCVNPDCLKTLKKMLKNRRGGKTPNEMVSIVPFDMIRYAPKKPTLFENNLMQVLETEVQSEKFGCKIDNLHVRIGSKIHIKKFYEAELLLHNNYYTSRFAYWLFEEICANKNIELNKQITLVGYENYSEMLLNELREMLKVKGIYADYIIYEQKTTEKFRYAKTLTEYRSSQFILIVPINSTMTTHIKVAGFLEKSMKEELKKEGNQETAKYQLSKTVYYGIILVAPDRGCQNEYWKYSKKLDHVIISNIDQSEMKYYMLVQTKWSHPLKCKECFPSGDYTKEIPLIETNKESVIPMQAIGMRCKAKPKIESEIEEDKIRKLSKFLMYKHTERNGNHFNYYFCTERLWDNLEIKEDIQKWLEGKSKLFPMEEQKTYDVIVAPLHYSNTAFVEEVNHWLFKNVALVLHFDIDKEFRMNVKAKYSSLQQLYDNLCEEDEKSTINFHYIDDTIVSGRTYHRSKSIIRSLITEKQGAKIEINLFKSVVLLLNRMSLSSIKEYISEPQYFLAYFNLNISSMRVNADACILCKKYEQWNALAEQAALNEVYLYWKDKSARLECVPAERLNRAMQNESLDKQKRAGQYMLASHKAKGLLDQICDCCDNDEIEDIIVEKLFPEPGDKSFDELIAMLKVLGRPFLSFRRETKEAVFRLMLTMFDQLLSETKPQGSNKLQIILQDLWDSPLKRTDAMIILINRLAELESNYIIRKKTMNRLLSYVRNHYTKEKHKEGEDFKNNYLNRIKQLVGQSNDFAKGLFLEYLVLYDKEYDGKYNFDVRMALLVGRNDTVTFKRKVYLENTKLLNYGIEALAWNFESDDQLTKNNLINALRENYYLDNFVQYLAFHKMINVDGQGEATEFVSETHVEQLKAMVRFQMLFHEVFPETEEGVVDREGKKQIQNYDENLKNIFQRMLDNLQKASGALDAEIIVPYRGNIENANKYIALEFGGGTDIRSLRDKEEQLFEFMENISNYEGNTYTIKEWGNRQWVIVKFCDVAMASSNISMIFLVFPFEIEQKGNIIHSLKNILVFREKTWKLLNLSSSTLLQNWTDNLYYKQQMLKDKATSHAECLSLHKILERVSAMICDSDSKDELLCEYFNLVVNSLIGYMNAQTLGGKGKDFFAGRSAKLKNLKGDQAIYDAMKKVWNLVFEIKGDLADREIRNGTEIVRKIPELNAMRVLFLAVFQNVTKHGKKNEEGKYLVSVYGEEDRLCIANEVDSQKKDEAFQSINSERYRRGNGISQAVIFDMCHGWYSDTDYEEMFKMEKSDDNRWSYVVKLPIIRKEGAE